MKSSIAIAALVAASLGVAAIAPVSAQTTSSSAETATSSSSAQSTTSSSAEPATSAPDSTSPGSGNTAAHPKPMHRMQGMQKPWSGNARQMIFGLTCSNRSAAMAERMLDRMEQHLQLNADQAKLFADFKTKSLTSATTFADACQAARPSATAGERPSVIDRLKAEVAIDTARLTALNDVLPSFEAFFNSLTDQQKADLFPRHGMRTGMDRHNQRGPGADRQDQRGTGTDRPARPAAPGR